MKLSSKHLALPAVGALSTIGLLLFSRADASSCFPVQGTFTSQDAANCPTSQPCGEGAFAGDFQADFTFLASQFGLYQNLPLIGPPPAASDPAVIAVSGVFEFTVTHPCQGTMSFANHATVQLPRFLPEGELGYSAGVVLSTSADGGCAGASGRFRTEGVLDTNGCIGLCTYQGELCGIEIDDSSSDSSDSSSDSSDD